MVENLPIHGFFDVFSSSDLVNPFPLNHFATVLQFTVKSETCKNDWSKEKRCRHWKAGSRIVYPNALLSRLCMQKTLYAELSDCKLLLVVEKMFPSYCKLCHFTNSFKKTFGTVGRTKFFLYYCS